MEETNQRELIKYTIHKIAYQDSMKELLNLHANLSKLCEEKK